MAPADVDSTCTLDDEVDLPRHPLANREEKPAGETVGRYRILDRLGAGGMGVVYLAHDPSLDRQVALKVLHRGRDRADGQVSLVGEAKALARLQHPNVVTVHDVGVADGLVYVAMERIEGRTLAAWIEEVQPTWRERVAAFVAAGRGLAAAHAAG
ncbi:MAG: protein kinase, partial [Deltaproteobacteria bacterium]|nr:protein kinase [Kofleriaceae bacterium]